MTMPASDPHAVSALVAGWHGDPFSLLGRHATPEGQVIRTFQPGARKVIAVAAADGAVMGELALVHPEGLFAGEVSRRDPYRLRITWPAGEQEIADPYAFDLLLGDLDLHLIAEGTHRGLADCLGAQRMKIDAVDGYRFAVWAPNAKRVSVVGDFNQWDGRRHPMRRRVEAGVWELFIPGVRPAARYKYEILGPDGGIQPLKADPCGQQTEVPPATASLTPEPRVSRRRVDSWEAWRHRSMSAEAPVSIYEVHPGSWLRNESGDLLDWNELGARLIPYAAEMGFTHLELLPITEHPFDGSWGYQPVGLFAPTARFGSPEGFGNFVERAHGVGIGLILDWVPGHFPSDPHGLGRFDGTALYEHADPREGFHHDWNTLIYNFGRHEVRGYLIASALHWLKAFDCDGIRVDAVASMLYRDYSRPGNEWIPNVYGGRENLEAVAFLRELNREIRLHAKHAATFAEESTAWPGVSAPEDSGGLGFDYKWNMGWMHDSLRYMMCDPLYRSHHHSDITFGLSYAFSERFVLPLSHDEVVHGKGSLLGKMPGDRWQKFANLRAYYGFMFAHPGKKLLFMGGEFGQEREWGHQRGLDWHLLDDPQHKGLQRLVRDLNRLYAGVPALHRLDCSPEGFAWVIGDDARNSVFAFLRTGCLGEPAVLAVSNFTPMPHQAYRVGVPQPGLWREALNTDATTYGGGGSGNLGSVMAEPIPMHGHAQSVSLTLPGLATILLMHDLGR